jgi:hypothetical protein
MTSKSINDKLINDSDLPPLMPKMSRLASIVAGIDWHDFEYKESSNEPKISFSTLTLIILAPLLVVVHIHTAKYFSIPILQYFFVGCLVAFLYNYLAILRRHELMPYLPSVTNDRKLKVLCMVFYASIVLSIFVGWNGSGGILFAIVWESIRGGKMGIYKYFYVSIIVGLIILENNYTIMKLAEFIPGILFGFINTEIAKLKASNPYAITHQLVFFCSMLLPVFFAASSMIVPSLIQWAVLVVGGFVMLFTFLVGIKLMQNGRVSVVMAVTSGIVMMGTTAYVSTIDVVGLVLIIAGIVMLIKKEYFDTEF